MHYDQEARRYIQSVATTERRQALIDSYHNEGLELFTSQLRNLRILLLTTFDDVLEDAASKEDPEFEFDTITSEARSRYEDEFTSVATRTAIDSANWDWEYALKELQSGLSQRIKASNSERKATEPLSASKAEWVHSDQLITSKVTLYRDGTLVVEVEADNDDSWQGPSWTCSRCSP